MLSYSDAMGLAGGPNPSKLGVTRPQTQVPCQTQNFEFDKGAILKELGYNIPFQTLVPEVQLCQTQRTWMWHGCLT